MKDPDSKLNIKGNKKIDDDKFSEMNDIHSYSSTINISELEQVYDVELIGDQKMVVTVIFSSNLNTWPRTNQRAERRIYVPKNGKIVLEEVTEGSVIPKRTVEAKIQWADDTVTPLNDNNL